MRPYLRYTLAAVVLAIPACELVDLTLVLDDVQYDAWMSKLAISEDGDQIWADRDRLGGGRELVAFANDGGEELATVGPFGTGHDITDLAAAHESGFESDVWVLHESGFRTRWNPDGNLSGFGMPDAIQDAFPGEDRQWCGLVVGLDGAAYVMSGHQIGIYTHWHLYREKDGVVTRTEGPWGGPYCPEIAYDLPLDEVAVAVDRGYGSRDVFWFDPDTMDQTHTVEIVASPQAIAAFNHKVAVGSSSFIRIWDADGSVTDTDWSVDVQDLDVQYGDNMVRQWWSGLGPDNHTVGWFRLE